MRFQAILAIIFLCLATTLFAFPASNAFAALIPTVVTDSPTQLEVVWDWNPEDIPSLDWPTLVYWEVFLSIQGNLGASILGLTATHLARPHGEAADGTQVVFDLFFSSGDTGFLASESKLEVHTPHGDEYFFSFFRGADPADTVISLDGQHLITPEPTTLLLLCSGLVGLAGFSRRKRR
jgi:hypothetical protein